MSDVMLLGILRMPLDDTPEGLGVIAWTQIKSVMREAASRIEADAARIAELEAALKPFAVQEQKIERWYGTDEEPIVDDDTRVFGSQITVGDLRAARAALEKKE